MQKMNLPTFLKNTDTISKTASHEQLESFIHEIARTLPETGRNSFLEKFKAVVDSPKNKADMNEMDDRIRQELKKEIDSTKERLVAINKGELCLDSEYNEYWDEWYDEDDDNIIFKDPLGLLDDIDKAMRLVHKCIDMEMYVEGFGLAELVSALELSVDGDYLDCYGQDLYLYDLDTNGLLSYSYTAYVKDAVYLAYMGNDMEDRPDKIYCTMDQLNCYELTLEDVMQSGEKELEDWNEFLILWIGYLGSKLDRLSDRLILEAQSMLDDEDAVINNARLFAKNHPALFVQILENGRKSKEPSQMLSIGKEALSQIEDKYMIRSNIGLLTAEYAVKLNDIDEAEQCWFEAYRSETTPLNYLRIVTKSRDYTVYREQLTEIYESVYAHSRKNNLYMYGGYNKLPENEMSKTEHNYLLFLDGKFDQVWKKAMNFKEALGWSETFMKDGMALFLLLLYKGEYLLPGIRKMCIKVMSSMRFVESAYNWGTGKVTEYGDVEALWKCFRIWKADKVITDNNRKQWISGIENMLEKRVAGIMSNNRRNYYGECAGFIAALSEVEEAAGLINSRQQILQKYKNAYPRRRTFHQELRDCGMV